MVFSQYLLSVPYSMVWFLLRLFSPKRPVVFYCAELIDYYTFAPVQKQLSSVSIVSNNPEVIRFLAARGIPCRRLPVFPKAVIMCRHATHKFPFSGIIKIGMRHGPYHFKRMTKAANYNQFDLFMFTSGKDLEMAVEIGVTVGKAIGFPRLDPALGGSISTAEIANLRKFLNLNPALPTLLFTATWSKSGMSAVDKWYDKLGSFIDQYNVLVTLHPWTETKYRDPICATQGVVYVTDADLTPYIMLSDLCIGDVSSLLAECSALGKPIVSFKTPRAARSLDEIEELMDMISVRIGGIDELSGTIDEVLLDPHKYFPQRDEANRIMFDDLDGKAGLRAAKEIIRLIPELKP
ncbi:MAG: hypothetical protein CVU48_08920 [Candidatus Cloacimonetes bacterium HGW-Cloacimonetes-1]|jgi:hypothetical protein|nr:MAG: hypothetical protein CVU48_08920 [Candidatus Cloacimonetes bacterium HGW-Cloacimonetes-1]